MTKTEFASRKRANATNATIATNASSASKGAIAAPTDPSMRKRSPVVKKGRPAANAAAKPDVKPASPMKTAKTPTVQAHAVAPVESSAMPKSKLVRDSFTIPKAEYETLAALKKRALSLGVAAKKSELLRAGIAAMQSMNDSAFLANLSSVPSLKTGRPKGPTAA